MVFTTTDGRGREVGRPLLQILDDVPKVIRRLTEK